ncbi:MAG TPA: HPr-rel-A system PqqD family peptide chaperone [Rhodocyclaceae bacterium]|nr:HPr-rel-A system PqqD family peptide chaperone [Rhodocyclaceae bacterium]
MMHHSERWVWHEWDDGAVVFDRLTGDTHALDPLSIEICQLPVSVRSSADMAAKEIAARLSETLDENLCIAVQEAFDRLRQRELI